MSVATDRSTRDEHVGDVPSAVILEVEPEGHRLHYVGHLWNAVDPATSEIVVSTEAAGPGGLAVHPRLSGARTVVLPPDATSADALRTALDRSTAGPGLLVLPDGDRHLLRLVPLLLRRPRSRVALVLMRPMPLVGQWAEATVPTVAKILVVQALRLFPGVRLRFLTDGFGVERRRRGYPGLRPVRDPVLPLTGVRESRPAWMPERSPDTFLVGLFGVVSDRKNLHLLIGALDEVEGMLLVVGGRLDPGPAALLDGPDATRHRAAGRLVVHDGPLSPDEFGGALGSVDVTSVVHDNDSPSGILVEACLRGTPSIVAAGGWLARIATATGTAVPVERDVRSVAEGIRRLRGSIDGFRAAARASAAHLGTRDFTDGLVGGGRGHGSDHGAAADRSAR